MTIDVPPHSATKKALLEVFIVFFCFFCFFSGEGDAHPEREVLHGEAETIHEIVVGRATPEEWNEWLGLPLAYASKLEDQKHLVQKLEEARENHGSSVLLSLASDIGWIVSQNASVEEWRKWLCLPLAHAARRGLETLVKKLIKAGADCRAGWRGGRDGRTLIHEAAEGGSKGVLVALHEAGAEGVNEITNEPFSMSPLYIAALEGKEAVGAQLLLFGADPNFQHPLSGYTPLHKAMFASEALAKNLILAGAEVNAKGRLGGTPLMLACLMHLENVVYLLLHRGADKDAVTENGTTALMCAMKYPGGSKLAVVQCLLKAGVDVTTRTTQGESAFDRACASGSVPVVEALVAHGVSVSSENRALPTALDHRRVMVAHLLVEGGANLDFRDSRGYTPLHIAVQLGSEGLVSSMLRKGVDKDARSTQEGETALILACVDAELTVGLVETLLGAGVDVNVTTFDGYSALGTASQKGNTSVMTALLDRGAKVNDRNQDGESALHFAAAEGHVNAIDILVGAGAELEFRTRYYERTPLLTAAWGSKIEAVFALLRHGASINIQDWSGKTLLFALCYLQPAGLEEAVDALLKLGADESIASILGDSPVSALDVLHEGRGCNMDEIGRVRQLLTRAPADRAWRRRGWIVMFRSRASRKSDEESSSSKAARRDGDGTNEEFSGVVEWLGEMEPLDVFKSIVSFL